jgi:hypothetical protein
VTRLNLAKLAPERLAGAPYRGPANRDRLHRA